MRHIYIYTYLLLAMLVGCESDADIDIKAERKTVVYAFVEAGDRCEVHAYQSILFTEASAKKPLGEETEVNVIIDGKESHTKQLSETATSVEFDGLELHSGSSIEVKVVREGKQLVYASSYIPSEPTIRLTRGDEIEKEGQYYKSCTLMLNDDGIGDNYYQLLARDTKTGDVIEGVKYIGRIFEESKSSIINDDEGRGLFTNANLAGRIIKLNCDIPMKDVEGDIELELYHMTYEHYCYMQSVAIHKAYMLLPVFGQNGLYNNVVNGIGLLSGVARTKVLVE
ncbi:MAG: DUF4249 family protein [Bacteroidia bacterium]|nr:DUF4249 family protein [Bacteroidia bacterium]